MAQAPKAYMTEFSVILASARWVALTASELATGIPIPEPHLSISAECHIYAICRCPNFSFEPESFGFENGVVSGRISYRVKGKPHFLEFKLPYEIVDGAIDVRLSPYPHREFESVDANGEGVRYVPARMIAMAEQRFREFEVMYIGQAYAEGRRGAFDRLRGHSTLQKILAESLQQSPDDNIFLLAFEYDNPIVVVKFDGINKNAIRGPEDDARLKDLQRKLGLAKDRQICLAEAGLTRYTLVV